MGDRGRKGEQENAHTSRGKYKQARVGLFVAYPLFWWGKGFAFLNVHDRG